MAEYAMVLKNGKDIIYKANQQTLKEAIKYFAGIKQMPIKDFKEIFIVIKLKD